MNKQKLISICNPAKTRTRHVSPRRISTARIVCVDGGYQLQARIKGSSARWLLSSPGGVADSTTDLPLLCRYAAEVLHRPAIRLVFSQSA